MDTQMMNMSGSMSHSLVHSNYSVQNSINPHRLSCDAKIKVLICILIIVFIGAAIVGSIGLAGLGSHVWHWQVAAACSQLSKIVAIIMVCVGFGSQALSLIISITLVCALKKRKKEPSEIFIQKNSIFPKQKRLSENKIKQLFLNNKLKIVEGGEHQCLFYNDLVIKRPPEKYSIAEELELYEDARKICDKYRLDLIFIPQSYGVGDKYIVQEKVKFYSDTSGEFEDQKLCYRYLIKNEPEYMKNLLRQLTILTVHLNYKDVKFDNIPITFDKKCAIIDPDKGGFKAGLLEGNRDPVIKGGERVYKDGLFNVLPEEWVDEFNELVKKHLELQIAEHLHEWDSNCSSENYEDLVSDIQLKCYNNRSDLEHVIVEKYLCLKDWQKVDLEKIKLRAKKRNERFIAQNAFYKMKEITRMDQRLTLPKDEKLIKEDSKIYNPILKEFNQSIKKLPKSLGIPAKNLGLRRKAEIFIDNQSEKSANEVALKSLNERGIIYSWKYEEYRNYKYFSFVG